MTNNFKATIGIECHVQLNSVSKLFSGASNDDREAQPNTLVNHIDFGLPGALPVFNEEVLNLAIKAAVALKTRPQLFSVFDRKHYFYPDLPMGYQITQYDQPIILGGKVEFMLDSKKMTVNITRAHIEADAGKSTHPANKPYSLVDLNRAGTPLLEIVSEPEMHTPAEAKAYAKELYLLMRNAEVTAGDLYHGNMRFDVNVSVSDNNQLGVRTETKNLNSFRAVEKAVEYEIKRQVEVINGGGKIVQETRGWNEAKQKTVSQRSKENADDYRYFPDPDLPPVVIDDKLIDQLALSMHDSLDKQREDLKQLGLNNSQIENLIEANIDSKDAGYISLIRQFEEQGRNAKQLANWLVNIDIPLMRETTSAADRYKLYFELSEMINAAKLSSTNAKELIVACLNMDKLPDSIERHAIDQGLIQQSDESAIESAANEVIQKNKQAVQDYLDGQTKVMGFLIGQVMALTKGQANPGVAKKLLEKLLKEI